MQVVTKKAAYEAESRAAAKGIAYSQNPYGDLSADLRLEWSRGHNSYRANKAKINIR